MSSSMKKWEQLLNDTAEFAVLYRDLQSLLWKLYWHHRSRAKGAGPVSVRYNQELQKDIANILTRMGHNIEFQEMWEGRKVRKR